MITALLPNRPLHQQLTATLLLCVVTAAAAGGCAKPLRSIDAARQSFAAGDLVTARQTLAKLSAGRSRYAQAASLDLAMVELASGDVDAAESRLRGLRDRFDAMPEIAPVQEVASLVTDDTARVFRPAGYEEVMIRAMLAVCSLADDQFDAESYALQATTRQAELAQRAEQRGILDAADVYQPIAMAPYLRGMLREATHHDYDDAARAYQLVSSVRPQFAPAQSDIARANGGTHSAPGHGVLYVLACVGRGPVLHEVAAPATSAALSIASAALNAGTNDSGLLLPNLAEVKVPQVRVPTSEIAAVGVRIRGQLLGATQTLTDVGELAVRQTEAEMPWTIARAVVRRTTKEIAVAKAGDTLGLDGGIGSLFHFAAATAWSGVERADTRCWGLLPREVQVFRAELPAGSHEITLQPLGFAGEAIRPGQFQRVEIVDGRNRYLIVIAPTAAMYVVANQPGGECAEVPDRWVAATAGG